MPYTANKTANDTDNSNDGCVASVQHVDKKWNPVDYDNAARSVEVSAKACAARCERTSLCIGASYWMNKGCHLATKGAILVDTARTERVISYSCTLKGY